MRAISGQKELMDLLATGEKLAVLFHTRWCPFCRVLEPVFVETSGKLGGFQPVECLLDDLENPLWAGESIQVVPTVVFFDGGRELSRVEAATGIGLSRAQLEQAWNKALGAA